MLLLKFAFSVEIASDHRPASPDAREQTATRSFLVRLFKFLRDCAF
jgi:hypothetical protein